MAIADIFEQRLLLSASVYHKGTPGMKPAPAGRSERTWHIPSENDALRFVFDIRDGNA